MTEVLTLDLVAPDLDEADLARLTEQLHERLRQVDGFEVERAQKPVEPGSKPIVSYIAGQLVIAMATKVAQPAIDEAKEVLTRIVHSWLQGITSLLTVRVCDETRTIVLSSAAAASPPTAATMGRPGTVAQTASPSGSSAPAANPAPGEADRPAAARAATDTRSLQYALLIGNQTFGDNSGIAPLACAANDVHAMRRSLLQYPEVYTEETITTLIDAPHYEIESAIDDVLTRAKDATVLLFYSGHGKTSSVGGELYLAAANSDAKRIAVTGVEYSKIVRLINQNNAKRVGIILDCCYAGMANRQSKGDVADQLNATTQQAGKGLYVIGASLETQTAVERVSDGLGVLTKVITEGMDTGAADVAEQGRVSFDNLYDYVSRTIGEFSHQVPIRSVTASGTDLIIAPSRHPKLRRRSDATFPEEIARIKDALRTSRKAFPPALFDQIFLSFVPTAQNVGDYIRDDDRYQVLLDFAYRDADVAKVVGVFSPAALNEEPPGKHADAASATPAESKRLDREVAPKTVEAISRPLPVPERAALAPIRTKPPIDRSLRRLLIGSMSLVALVVVLNGIAATTIHGSIYLILLSLTLCAISLSLYISHVREVFRTYVFLVIYCISQFALMLFMAAGGFYPVRIVLWVTCLSLSLVNLEIMIQSRPAETRKRARIMAALVIVALIASFWMAVLLGFLK